MQLNQSH
jgi:hypothetical protein